MGMDVYGTKPTNETGEYFRNSVWSWRPLADYCCEVAPDITKHCIYWQSNDGDGLNATYSVMLATRLRREIESGRTWKYAQDRIAELRSLPSEPCNICGSTGKRLPPPNCGPGDQPCNACNSTGHIRPYATMYLFSEENVMEFIKFLEVCGGFKIC